ncbi:hypothetical protein CHU98_g5866 [Xylaria longipes]|nr:hypothetical protein CHU98_g5866 [Xylaria longipes]
MTSPYNTPKRWPRHGDNVHGLETDDCPDADSCATWISDEYKKISAAFPRPSKSSQPISCGLSGGWYHEDSDVDSRIIVVRPWHNRPEDPISCFTILTDPEPAAPIPIPHQPSQEGQLGGALELKVEYGGSNDGGNQQNANGDTEYYDIAADQRWRIDEHGHLIVSNDFAILLTDLNLEPTPALTEEMLLLEDEQSEAVILLAAEDRQLEALRLALRFAITTALGCTNDFNVIATVRLRFGSLYPSIDIFMSEWWPETQLQPYIAYYILREMLKRYRHVPFPDRLDIWEVGIDAADMLLVPYGEEAEGEPRRVRQRITDELLAEGHQHGNQSLMQKMLAEDDHEMAFGFWGDDHEEAVEWDPAVCLGLGTDSALLADVKD